MITVMICSQSCHAHSDAMAIKSEGMSYSTDTTTAFHYIFCHNNTKLLSSLKTHIQYTNRGALLWVTLSCCLQWTPAQQPTGTATSYNWKCDIENPRCKLITMPARASQVIIGRMTWITQSVIQLLYILAI